MAFYYCKSTGTATGDGGRYASAKTATDDWATAFSAPTEYYDSVLSAFGATTPPATDDYILISDASTYSDGNNTSWSPSAGGIGVNVVCVDDDNVGQAVIATAAQETITSGRFLKLCNTANGRIQLYGLWLKVADWIGFNVEGAYAMARNCTLETTSSDGVQVTGDGSIFELIDCTWKSAVAGDYIKASGGGRLIWRGGVLDAASGITELIKGSGANGGGSVHIIGVDLSDCAGALTDLADDTGEDAVWIRLERCTINASLTLPSNETMGDKHKVELYNCASSAAAAEYGYQVYQGLNYAIDETTIYRDNSTAYPAGQKVSLKCLTGANVNKFRPFSFTLPTRYAELSNTASDIIRVYLACATTLNTDDVWIDISYPDGTNKQINTYLSGIPSDPLLDSSTALDTSTETWFDDSEGDDVWAGNEYQIDIDTSGDAGADSVPIIWVYCAIGNTTIYFDTDIDFTG